MIMNMMNPKSDRDKTVEEIAAEMKEVWERYKEADKKHEDKSKK
jgi:predicted RNase H-like HicB family nuclease